MSSRLLSILGIILVSVLVIVACAPQVKPLTPTAPAPAATQPASPTSRISPLASQDAWEKVVEAARKEGKVTLYAYGYTGEVGIAITRAFKDKYGISVEIVTGLGAAFLERLKTEKRMGQIAGDIVEGNAANTNNMKLDGLTVKVPDDLPALKEKDVWLVAPFATDPTDKHILSYTIIAYAPYANSKLVPPGQEPQYWKDFLDPKWKGKLSMVDPGVAPGAQQLFLVLMREKAIDEEWVKNLYQQNPKFYTAIPDELRALARGENAISLRSVDLEAARLVAEGAPIKVVRMKDGTPIGPNVVAAVSGAPHPNAARLFLNWIMTAEGQTVHGQSRQVAGVRKDVADFRPEAIRFTPEKPILVTSEDVDNASRLFREKWPNKLWGR